MELEFVNVFILTTLALDKKGNVQSRNVAATFDLFEAEDHRNEGVENDYEVFVVAPDWQQDAAQSELVAAMREFRGIVKEMQDEALR